MALHPYYIISFVRHGSACTKGGITFQQYLYLANRSPEKSWKNVIAEYNLTESNCVHYNLPDNQQEAVEQYVGLTGYPTYRLFDKQGRIHHLNWTDDEDLPKFKEKLDALKSN